MAKFFTIVTKLGTIMSASVSVEDAKDAVAALDKNQDGKLSIADLVVLLIGKVQAKK